MIRYPRPLAIGLGLLITLGSARAALGFVYIFAGESNGVDTVTHPHGYNGAGGTLNVTLGIDPTSAFATDMAVAVENVVNTWNAQLPTTGNARTNVLPTGFVDFESVLLHEVGHSLGLAHPNLASESGLSGSRANSTKSTDGTNNTFNTNNGVDNVFGSADDIRGDDVNLHYFRLADNDPFNTNLGTVDSTTYSRDTADLPAGDNFAANADRAVGDLLGYANTEAAMQQGSFFREVQRALAADDVAGIQYARAGLDELANTADDYALNLVFAGQTPAADIVVDFDASQTSFAVSQNGGTFLGSGHIAITGSNIYFDPNDNWYFSLAGDLDNDGDVDNADLGKAAGSFTGAGGSTTLTRADGDVDGDGDVDNADLGLIAGQFTGSFAGSLAGSIDAAPPGTFIAESIAHADTPLASTLVPEPASALLMLAAPLAALATRPRRRRRSHAPHPPR